ncbi:MAG: EamA family transporter [Actinomycetota bacterium]
MTDTSTFSIWLALGSVYLIWGSTYLAIRVLDLHRMPPLLTAGARFILAGAIMFVVARLKRGSDEDRISLVHWRSALIVGAALLLGGNGLVVFAEQRVPSGVAALMIAAIPLWFAIFSWLFYRERLTPISIAGLALGIGGLVLLTDPFSSKGGIDHLGALALVIAPMSWAAGSLYSKRARLPRRPLLASAMQMFAGGCCLAVAGVVTGELTRLNPIDQPSWVAWTYLVLVGSLVGFTSYMWVLKNARTSLVSTYAYVNPIVAVLLGAWFLDERLSVRSIVGASVIVLGVAAIVSSAPQPTVGEEAPGPG